MASFPLFTELPTYALLLASAMAAGAVNAIAGGGTLLTFPSLLLVLSPVAANATSTLALVPGSLAAAWGFRNELGDARRLLFVLVGPSLLGGIVGSLLLTRLDPSYFSALIPYLILVAVGLFAIQPLVSKKVTTAERAQHRGGLVLIGVMAAQLLVGIYGGYFGAGIGILMLTTLAYLGVGDIYQMNAMKNSLAAVINGVSTAIFVAEGQVDWRFGPLMAIAAIAGGYLAARISRRLDRSLVRKMVIAIGFGLGIYYLVKQGS